MEVACRPNIGQYVVKYLLHNVAINNVLHRKIEVHGGTKYNEAYYISLVEGLKEENK